MNNAQTTQTPTVLREDESLRTECSRHYILENGARKAVFTAPQATEAGIAPQSVVLPDIDVGGTSPYVLINRKYSRADSNADFSEAGTVSYDYLRVMQSTLVAYEGTYTFDKEVIGIPDNQITSVTMILTPYGTSSDTNTVTLVVDDREYTCNGTHQLSVDITKGFCSDSSSVTIKMKSENGDRKFERTPMLDIVYMNDARQTCHRTFSGIQGIGVQLNVLTGGSTVAIDDITDPALGATVSHIFLPGDESTSRGKHFRLNFDETLVKKPGENAGYLYTNPAGEVFTFRRCLYKVIDGEKYDLTASEAEAVFVDVWGRLWNGTTEVYAEWRTPQGLTATARLDGIKNVEYFEQRQDKEKQLAEQIKAYQEAICRYCIGMESDGQLFDRVLEVPATAGDLEGFLTYAGVEERMLFSSEDERLSYISLLNQKAAGGNNVAVIEEQITLMKKRTMHLRKRTPTSEKEYNPPLNADSMRALYKEYRALSAQYESLMRQMPVAYLLGEDEVRGFNEKGRLVVVQNTNGRGILLEYEQFNVAGDTRLVALCDLEGNRKVRFLYDADGRMSDIENSVGDVCHFTYQYNLLAAVSRPGQPTLHITYNAKETRVTAVRTKDAEGNVREETALTYSGTLETLSRVTNRTYISSITHGTVARTTTATTLSDVTIIHSSTNGETLLVTENGVHKQKYVIDNTPCVTQYCEATDDKVTRAEKYTYEDGRVTQIEHLDKSRLYRYTTETVWTAFLANPVETFVYDFFGQEEEHGTTEYVSPRTTADTKKASSHTVNTYGTDRKLHTRTTTDTLYLSGGDTDARETEERFFYDDNGRMVRKESEVVSRSTKTGTTFVTKKPDAGTAVEEYTYNEDGYRIRTCLYNTKDPSSRFYTEEEVDGQGRPTASWDATGLHKTAYAYTARGAVREEIAPDGGRHAYGYLPDGRLGAVTGSTEDGEENSTTRAYTEDVVTELRSGRRTIEYGYDGKRRKNAVSVDGISLASFTYSGENTNAEKVAYSTPGTDISRTTNRFGEVTKTTCGTSGMAATYSYDTDHRLTSVTDSVSGKTTFTYDTEDRIQKATSPHCVENRYYDNKDRLSSRYLQNGTGAPYYCLSYAYTYDTDNNLTEILADGAYSSKPGKTDPLGRYTGKTLTRNDSFIEEESVAYIKHGDHATRLPSVIRYRNAGQGSTAYKYRYDARGNMTEVLQDGSLMCRYTYDTLGRLVREDNAPMGFTHLYTYDAQGNILRRRAYSVTFKPEAELPTDGYTDKVYTYDKYGDRLQSYDGESFAYNMVGNPIVYRGKAATWGDDRRLLSYNGTTFTYDARGNRMSKGDLQMYYDADSNLVYQSDGMYFFYDTTGLYALLNNGYVYFCRKDAMGNIVALLDSSGAVVVKYTYDAWGNCRVLNPDGTENTEPTFVGNRNPFRYRGYYFDIETGLYFLKTRYYDPAIGRFMTLDDFAYLDPDHVNGLNLYAYCNNNPVMFSDPTGHMPEWLETTLYFAGGVFIIAGCIALAVFLPVSAPLAFIAAGAAISAITGGVGGIISTLIAGGDIHDVGQAFFFGTVTGAISGAIAASPLKVGGQMVANALLNVCSYIITQSINGDPITFGGVMMNVVTGVLAGLIGKDGWLANPDVTNVVQAGLKGFMREAFKQVGAKSIAKLVLPGILFGGVGNGVYSRFAPAYRPENGFWNW